MTQKTTLTVEEYLPDADQLAETPVMGTTEAALAQDRYRRGSIPYVKFGRRVRYLRADVARYLVTHRTGGEYGA